MKFVKMMKSGLEPCDSCIKKYELKERDPKLGVGSCEYFECYYCKLKEQKIYYWSGMVDVF